jgi:16S rRNA (guanine(527)-N(7))-methyltransferase RsmG
MTARRNETMNAAEHLRRLAARHGFGAASAETGRLLGYLALLEKWNARINLTAATDWAAIGWLFEEALWAADFCGSAPQRHLDIGSGAGFPALPMKIVRPATQLCLVESRAKRTAFLETVAAALRLEGMQVVCARAEEYLDSPGEGPFDVISWKGLKLSSATFNRLLARCGPTTQFWLFHGPDLPFEDPGRALQRLTLVRQEQLPGHTGRILSIYAVSRETSCT